MEVLVADLGSPLKLIASLGNIMAGRRKTKERSNIPEAFISIMQDSLYKPFLKDSRTHYRRLFVVFALTL